VQGGHYKRGGGTDVDEAVANWWFPRRGTETRLSYAGKAVAITLLGEQKNGEAGKNGQKYDREYRNMKGHQT